MLINRLKNYFTSFLLIGLMTNVLAQESSLFVTRVSEISSLMHVNKIETSFNNEVWIGGSQGLIKYTVDAKTAEHFLEDLEISDLVLVPRIGVWASSTDGVHNPETGESIYLQKEAIISSLEYWKGRLWIGTNNGLFAVNVTSGRFEEFNTRKSKLKSNKINDLKVDANDVLWICTDAGEVRIKKDKWKNYHKDAKVKNVYENKEGLWFLSTEDMWLVDPYNREYNVGLDDSLYQGVINDFVLDSKGKMYVASEKLIRYDPYETKFEEFTENAGALSKMTTALAVDLQDNVWVGTPAGLYQLQFSDGKVAPLNAVIIIEQGLKCNSNQKAKLKVNVAGGMSPYSYKWSHNENASGANIEVESSEIYVTVTDANGLTKVADIIVQEPDSLRLSTIDIRKPSRFGAVDAEVNIRAAGGASPYTYLWDDQSDQPLRANLKSGDYQVTVVDKNDCENSFIVTIEDGNKVDWLKREDMTVGNTILANDIQFMADSTNVTPDSYASLDDIFTFLIDNPNISIEIGGHTNTVPPHEYCDKLSTERAKSIAEYFYAKGISSTRLSYKGYGKRNPITQDQSLAGRQKNQRVEIKVLGV